MFITIVICEQDCQLALWDYTRDGLQQVPFPGEKERICAENIPQMVNHLMMTNFIRAVIWQKVQASMPESLHEWLSHLGCRVKVVEIPYLWEAELPPIAQISGLPEIKRVGIYDRAAHAAVIEEKLPFPGTEANFIVICMDDGVSVAAYQKGVLLDVNNSLEGEGPMGLKRAGALYSADLVTLAFNSGQTYEELYRRIVNGGGWEAWKEHISEQKWEDILAYQIAKEVGAMRAVLRNEVDFIALTGRLAGRASLVERIILRLPKSIPVHVAKGIKRTLGLARIWVESINFRFSGC